MDHYKHSIIVTVRNNPLLWDPINKDYKNREQKKQVWDEIDRTILPPTGYSADAKSVWEQLMRGFCNVLKKKEKKSGSGEIDDKQWKFENAMQFLLPVKKMRLPSGNFDFNMALAGVKNEIEESEAGCDQEGYNPELEAPATAEFLSEFEQSLNQVDESQDQDAVTAPKFTTSKRKWAQTTSTEDEILPIIKELQAKTSKYIETNESPRFSFMKSIMPAVEELTQDDFMDFQIAVIQDLKKRRRAQKQPTPLFLYQNGPGGSTYDTPTIVQHTPNNT